MSAHEELAIRVAVDAYLHAIATGDQDAFDRAFDLDVDVINAGEAEPQQATTPIAVFAQRIQDAYTAGTAVEEIAQSLSVSYCRSRRQRAPRLQAHLRHADDV